VNEVGQGGSSLITLATWEVEIRDHKVARLHLNKEAGHGGKQMSSWLSLSRKARAKNKTLPEK
jgi:hypothetical protein